MAVNHLSLEKYIFRYHKWSQTPDWLLTLVIRGELIPEATKSLRIYSWKAWFIWQWSHFSHNQWSAINSQRLPTCVICNMRRRLPTRVTCSMRWWLPPYVTFNTCPFQKSKTFMNAHCFKRHLNWFLLSTLLLVFVK